MDVSITIDKGILEYVDAEKKIIKMQPLLSEVIWYRKNKNVSYNLFQNNIDKFFMGIRIGERMSIPYRMMYEAMWAVTFKFGTRISEDRSRKRRESWWNKVADMVEKLKLFGNADVAERMLLFLKAQCEKLESLEDTPVMADEFLEEIGAMKENSIMPILKGNIQEMNRTYQEWRIEKMSEFIERNDKPELKFIDKYIKILDGYIASLKSKNNRSPRIEFLIYYYCAVRYFVLGYSWDDDEGCWNLSLVYLCKAIDIAKENQDSEMEIRAELRWMYYRLQKVLLLEEKVSEEETKELKDHYDRICHLYKDKLWPWEISLLYQKTGVLYGIFEARNGKTEELLAKLEEIKSLFENQIIALDENEMRKMNQQINEWIQEIQKETANKIGG